MGMERVNYNPELMKNITETYGLSKDFPMIDAYLRKDFFTVTFRISLIFPRCSLTYIFPYYDLNFVK